MTPTEKYEYELKTAVRDLTSDAIEYEEFEKRCKEAWIELNGPVPVGRMLVVGIRKSDSRLLVGHIALPEQWVGATNWKFKSLAGVTENN